MTPQAEKRLTVLQSLDTLGAGFQLASHDLDLRGAGNLLGEEQSGHIKEVGYELYQQMVQDAIERLKAGVEEPAQDLWSPTISLGAPVTIPESYIPDLTTRLVALSPPFGAGGGRRDRRDGRRDRRPLRPAAARGRRCCLKLVTIKALCRRAHVEKLDAGAKGLTLAFRDNSFANPAGLVKWVTAQGSLARVRPGHADRRRRAISRSCRTAWRARWRSCARSPGSRGRRGRGRCVQVELSQPSLRAKRSNPD